MSPERGPSLARRTWLRAVLWGAGGLPFVAAGVSGCRSRPRATCYEPGAPPPSYYIENWAKLGRLWRELGPHARGRYQPEEGEEKLKTLEAEITTTLAALPASRELRTLFEERIAHVRRSRYSMATCYDMSAWNPVRAREDIEKQMAEVDRLLAEGVLSTEAAEKAARAVGADAEYLTRLRALQDETGPEAREQFGPVHEQHAEGRLEPGDATLRAGRNVVEFEADKPGLLTNGPVQ